MDPDDVERLTALRGFEILDSAPEEAFDDLVRVAAHVCGTPMAAVSLVDEHRQWFKARVGLPLAETPRSDAFCAYTILQRGVLEIPDPKTDPRFVDNPLVTGELRVRFYAAAPLVTHEDLAIGTLCVLDRVPRRLGSAQRIALQSLANQTMAQVALRQQVMATQRLEQRFRAVINQSADLIALVDASGGLRYVSPSVRTVLGYDPDDPDLSEASAIIVEPEALATLRAVLSSSPGHRSPPLEVTARRKDGTTARLEISATNLLDEPAVAAVVLTCRDVTERRRAESALERARQHATSVLDTANDTYIEIDSDGVILEWNREAAAVFGWDRSEAVGRPLVELIIPPHYREAHSGGLARAALSIQGEGQTVLRGLEVTAQRRDGSVLPVEVTVWSTPGLVGEATFSAFVRDISERRALEDRLAHRALHDELTGLPNRYLLGDRLESALVRARRTGDLVGVMFCDLDRFKVVNDSSGHTVGDEILKETARRLETAVRHADTVVRFGGDEFVVVAEDLPNEMEVSMLAERIRSALAEPLIVGGVEMYSSVSIGVATSRDDAVAELLISDADAAMYLAKERGRNRIEVFNGQIRERVHSRLADERALRRAIEENELRLHYQPIVSLPGGRVVGAEALVRWERPGHGLLGPSTFIELAEDSGLIVPLGTWVLHEACRQLRACGEARPDLPFGMSVNVSAHQVANGDLVEVVSRAVEAAGVEAGSVTLELTETTLMENLSQSNSTLMELQALGVLVAIDDFGTGYSSLSYLKVLPIDTLKIDQSFVVHLGDDPYDSAIVGAIATIGRSLGLHIVAEGVETAEQLVQVEAHGCGRAQGYYFARPMAADALGAIVGETLAQWSGDSARPPSKT